MDNKTLDMITETIGNPAAMKKAVRTAMHGESEGWTDAGKKFLRFLADGRPRFSVFVEGNSKLPFLSFSVLPFVTCPGMGACRDFCYSVRAHRYPAAYMRQLQNTVLIKTAAGRRVIAAELTRHMGRRKFSSMPAVDVRLYVDGDIDSVRTLDFWIKTMRQNPRARFYGYSKSWDVFRRYAESRPGLVWPENYRLNLSSGSRYREGGKTAAFMQSLPIVRGEFVAVDIGRRFPAVEQRGKEYRDAVLAAAGRRGFVCPGRCGTCTSRGHACGSKAFHGVPIFIGKH